MGKRTERQKAKDKAWDSFSRYIRLRDCLKSTGDPERGLCVTCQREYPFKQLQAGHFLGGRGNAVLFDEDLVHAQCYGCNVGRMGSYVEYFLFMEREYGREKVDEFIERKHKSVIYKPFHFVELKELYDQKYADLLDKHKLI